MTPDEARAEFETLLQAARAYVLRGPDPAGERESAYRRVTRPDAGFEATCRALALDARRVRSAFRAWRRELID
jgi:hypothetical protein